MQINIKLQHQTINMRYHNFTATKIFLVAENNICQHLRTSIIKQIARINLGNTRKPV